MIPVGPDRTGLSTGEEGFGSPKTNRRRDEWGLSPADGGLGALDSVRSAERST